MSVNELFALDKRVSEFRDLQNLDVQSNQLTSLPSSFSQLQHLTSLNLARNALSRVPSCILALTSLVSLDLSDNMLDTLWSQADAEKAGIAASDVLRSLATLNLAYNCLSTSALVPMPASLKRLQLSHNLLREPLPIDICGSAVHLEELVLSGNDLPDAVFAHDGTSYAFPHLHVLDVRKTHVSSLSTLESLFASAPSLNVSEAKDKNRAPVHAPRLEGAPVCTPHQLVRVANIPTHPDKQHDPVWIATHDNTLLPPLYILSDVQGRSESSHRRRRGGRGRGGEDRARTARDERDENGHAPPNAGSALANAKLSTKKKEALGQVPCKFFRNNGCSAGDACPFAHTMPGEGQPKAVCQWYIKGSCRFGHRCALAHILPGQPMSVRMNAS